MIRRFLVVMLVVMGCQKTNQQAIDAAKPAWAKVRIDLAAMSPLLGTQGEARLEELSWVELSPEKTNTAFITDEQLRNPEAEQPQGELDLYEGGTFLKCLQWTGPHSQMSERARGERTGDTMRDRCAAALQTRYLVVLDTTASKLPELNTEGTFAGGQATVQVTVLDRLQSKALASFTVEGVPAQEVHYEVRPDEEKAARLAAAVHSTMWTNARTQIFDKLRSLGATLTTR